MIEVSMKSKDFRELIRFFKRAAIIGDTYLVKNDIWLPEKRLVAGKPGEHILKGFPIKGSLSNNVYRVKNIKELATNLDGIKGKLGIITLSISESAITLTVQNIITTVGVITNAEVKEGYAEFDDLLTDLNWVKFTDYDIKTMRSKGLITVYSIDGDPIRLTKSHFKLNGVEQVAREPKYTAYYFARGLDSTVGVLQLHVKYDFFESFSIYSYARYIESTKSFEEL